MLEHCGSKQANLAEHTGQSTNGIEVGGLTLAKDVGGGSVGLGRVGDRVGLTGNDTTSGVGVDLEGESSGDESSAGGDDLEETHFDVVWGLLIR